MGESVVTLEKNHTAVDSATPSLQAKLLTKVANVDTPRICVNQAEDEEDVIKNNVALVVDPDLEWASLVESSETDTSLDNSTSQLTPKSPKIKDKTATVTKKKKKITGITQEHQSDL